MSLFIRINFMSQSILLAAFLIFNLTFMTLSAGDFYVTYGSNTDNEDSAFSIGLLSKPSAEGFRIGVDLGFEGEKLECYGGDCYSELGLSFNGIVGYTPKDSKWTVGVLAGFAEQISDCPRSNLGFRCWADGTPDTEYGFNYGGFLQYHFEKYGVFLRATPDSTQAGITFRF